MCLLLLSPALSHSVQPGHWLQGPPAWDPGTSEAGRQLPYFSLGWPITGVTLVCGECSQADPCLQRSRSLLLEQDGLSSGSAHLQLSFWSCVCQHMVVTPDVPPEEASGMCEPRTAAVLPIWSLSAVGYSSDSNQLSTALPNQQAMLPSVTN